jgi:hypothetical protein
MDAELCFLQAIDVGQLSQPTSRDAHVFVLCFGSQLSVSFHHTVINVWESQEANPNRPSERQALASVQPLPSHIARSKSDKTQRWEA